MHRRIIIVTLSILLAAAISCVILLSLRGSGPPLVVQGNLSAKDISQIQRAVRHQLWRETFPNFSIQTFKSLPANIHAAMGRKVVLVWSDGLPKVAYALWKTNEETFSFDGYYLTNGPAGWHCTMPYIYYVSPN